MAASADVSLTLANGKVTIVARNATPRQVLAEWAAAWSTRIVNLERVPGGPDTFELRDVPESKALAIVLRASAGYIAAPRPAGMPGTSVYDRIMVLPTSVASGRTAGPRPAGRRADPSRCGEPPRTPPASPTTTRRRGHRRPVFPGWPDGVHARPAAGPRRR